MKRAIGTPALILVALTTGVAIAASGAAAEVLDSVLRLPEQPFRYAEPDWPDHFRTSRRRGRNQASVLASDNEPADNPVTDHGATLGRVLFYDTGLSHNGTISCSSCHVQEAGFSDSRRLSVGFSGKTTRRHSMSLTNARFYDRGRFFWDERAQTLEEQVLLPIQDPVEMGLSLDELKWRVAARPYYPGLFENAFGDPLVTTEKISKALAQFVRSLVSFESRYDQGRASSRSPNQPFRNFSSQENRGKELFLSPPDRGGAGCGGCHTTDAFINNGRGPINNGLDASTRDDQGAFEGTGFRGFRGSFKVPSLRNIAVTAPYMHDGRFATLEEVIEHYSTGVQDHPNLGRGLTHNGQPVRFNFSDFDKQSLVAFLHTLTDDKMLKDPRFSDPFVR